MTIASGRNVGEIVFFELVYIYTENPLVPSLWSQLKIAVITLIVI